ncbi:hypothetical protein AQUCO_01400215v1 [Aquilegia coerulea]|uniref:Uncharacterized protein n=1 Tax=Aquilegia coerulea TaxID=218851 RepID=A0A2G5DV54_AQUCA|nr:hypothetical protein AQUCO_01400215v1 [Aquilegia coerulea]
MFFFLGEFVHEKENFILMFSLFFIYKEQLFFHFHFKRAYYQYITIGVIVVIFCLFCYQLGELEMMCFL